MPSNTSLNSPGLRSLHLFQENHSFLHVWISSRISGRKLLLKNHTIMRNTDCQYPSGSTQNRACRKTCPSNRSKTAGSGVWPSGRPHSPPGRAYRCLLYAFTSRFRTRHQSPPNHGTTPCAALSSRRSRFSCTLRPSAFQGFNLLAICTVAQELNHLRQRRQLGFLVALPPVFRDFLHEPLEGLSRYIVNCSMHRCDFQIVLKLSISISSGAYNTIFWAEKAPTSFLCPCIGFLFLRAK